MALGGIQFSVGEVATASAKPSDVQLGLNGETPNVFIAILAAEIPDSVFNEYLSRC